MNENQRDGIRFAEIVLGVHVSEDPPPPGSKLARLIELEQEAQRIGMSDEEFTRRAHAL